MNSLRTKWFAQALPKAEVRSGLESGVCLTWLNLTCFHQHPHSATARSQHQASGCWKTPWPHLSGVKADSKAECNEYLNQINCAFGSYLSIEFGHRQVTSVKLLVSATEHFWAEHHEHWSSQVRRSVPVLRGLHASLSGLFLHAWVGRNSDANVRQAREQAVGNYYSNPGNQFSPSQSYVEGCVTAS